MPVHADRGTGCYHDRVHTKEAEDLRRWAEDSGTFRWDRVEDSDGTYFRTDWMMTAYFRERKADDFARKALPKTRTLWDSAGTVVANRPLRHQDPCDLDRTIASDPVQSLGHADSATAGHRTSKGVAASFPLPGAEDDPASSPDHHSRM